MLSLTPGVCTQQQYVGVANALQGLGVIDLPLDADDVFQAALTQFLGQIAAAIALAQQAKSPALFGMFLPQLLQGVEDRPGIAAQVKFAGVDDRQFLIDDRRRRRQRHDRRGRSRW